MTGIVISVQPAETAIAGRNAAGSEVFASRRSSGFTVTKMAITAANES